MLLCYENLSTAVGRSQNSTVTQTLFFSPLFLDRRSARAVIVKTCSSNNTTLWQTLVGSTLSSCKQRSLPLRLKSLRQVGRFQMDFDIRSIGVLCAPLMG